MRTKLLQLSLQALLALLCARSIFAQGTAFTYQGQLKSGGSPPSGVYDFQFGLYDASASGNQQGPTLTNTATVVSNGLFIVTLDFGNVFPGTDRWLDISVRSNGVGSFITLAPRERLAPAPYAITAAGVPGGAITADMLANGAVTTGKIAPGAVKGYQIDDAGNAAYQSFQQAVRGIGGDSSVGFSELSQVVPTNGVTPAYSFGINGAAFGVVVGFSGNEGISRSYSYVVEVLVSGAPVDPETKIGLPGQLTFTRNTRSTSFGGIITAGTLSGSSAAGLLYTFRIESSLAYLGLTSDYRVYQNLATPDVVASVYQNVAGSTLTRNLVGSYPVHENLIQFAETSLNFFSRLLEDEGIFYYFDQSTAPPGLVISDSLTLYPSAPNSPFAYFGDTATNSAPGAEYVRSFQKAVHQSTLKATVNNYNFQTPAASLLASSSSAKGVGETYEFGTYAFNLADETLLAQRRRERHDVERATMSGSGTAPDLRAGYTFVLSDQSSAGLANTYLITSVQHVGFVRVTNGVSSLFYGNRFEAIPASLNFRPPLTTPRRQAQPCTAVVTGPAGQTTYVDKYGRIKVQFHWDRYGAKNETSSAWLRVSSPMAGASHGMVFLPRVGDEVLVSFLEGDPDRPVVTGSLYNAAAPPPYPLPASQTTSGIKSVSTDNQVNEINFDDAAGSQSFRIHAAKDLLIQANGQTVLGGPVAINGGTLFTNFLAGQAIVGSSSSYQTNFSISFPKAFVGLPKVVAATSNDPGWNVGDTFVATVRSVSATAFVVNIVRVDQTGGWSQFLRVNWIAWE